MTPVRVLTNAQTLTPEQEETLQQSVKIRRWTEKVQAAFEVNSVQVERAYFFGKRLGYVVARLDGTLNERRLPGLAFLRGDAVAVLIVLQDPDGQRWVALVDQPRVPIGATHFLEIPAGMTDEAEPVQQALTEVHEEVGLVMTAHELTEISRFYPSAGGCDEQVIIYCAERQVSHDVIASLHGQQTGAVDEAETIHVQMVRLEDFPRLVARDGKSLMAYYAYMAHLGQTATCVV